MVIEPSPGPALEMIQAQFFLHLLIDLLHGPPVLPEPDRRDPPRVGGQVRKGEPDLPVGLFIDQQPDRLGTRALARGPALAGPDSQPGEAAREFPLGSFPPRHLPQRCLGRQVLQTPRLGRTVGQARSRGAPAAPAPRRHAPPGFGGEDELVQTLGILDPGPGQIQSQGGGEVPLGSWPSCPGRRSIGAARPPNAFLAWGTRCRRSQRWY